MATRETRVELPESLGNHAPDVYSTCAILNNGTDLFIGRHLLQRQFECAVFACMEHAVDSRQSSRLAFHSLRALCLAVIH